MTSETQEQNSRLPEYFGRSPIAKTIGFTLEEAGDGRATVRLKVEEKHIHGGGIVQGGILFMIADVALTAAMFSLHGPQGSQIGEMKINFIRPTPPGGVLEARATVIHQGRRLCVGEVEIRNAEDKLVAKCQGTSIVNQPNQTEESRRR